MGQSNKTFARQGRGSGNGYNENWRNSPLWDSIDAKKSKDEKASNEETKNDDTQVVIEETEKTPEQILKEKQRSLFASIY